MDDYISLAAALKEVGVNTWAGARLKDLPAADVRPVVYCRYCMYAPEGDDDDHCLEWPCDDWPGRNPCPLKCEDNWYSKKPEPDFFCANGRDMRKEHGNG